MPALEVAGLNEKAVLWEAAGVNRNNDQLVLTPYEIDVRWDADANEIINLEGKNVKTDATVYLDQEVPMGSILWEGIYQDLDSPPTNLFRVVGQSYTNSLRGHEDEVERHVLVMRYHNKLPDVIGTG